MSKKCVKSSVLLQNIIIITIIIITTVYCLSPVDGGWSAWDTWTACSHTCGTGHQYRWRSCGSPSPAHGGKPCGGNKTEKRQCVVRSCPGRVLTNKLTFPVPFCAVCAIMFICFVGIVAMFEK